MQPDGTREHPSIPYIIFSGICAGIALWVPIFPIDVIKTELQVDSLTKPKYSGAFSVVKEIVRQGNYGRFYKGITPCILRGMAVNCGVFPAFEISMQLLNKYT